MKRIKETDNEHHWPRNKVESIECRKRDLVIRIAHWKEKDAPGYDVECYIGGVYDWNESKICATKDEAILFSQQQIKKLL